MRVVVVQFTGGSCAAHSFYGPSRLAGLRSFSLFPLPRMSPSSTVEPVIGPEPPRSAVPETPLRMFAANEIALNDMANKIAAGGGFSVV